MECLAANHSLSRDHRCYCRMVRDGRRIFCCFSSFCQGSIVHSEINQNLLLTFPNQLIAPLYFLKKHSSTGPLVILSVRVTKVIYEKRWSQPVFHRYLGWISKFRVMKMTQCLFVRIPRKAHPKATSGYTRRFLNSNFNIFNTAAPVAGLFAN